MAKSPITEVTDASGKPVASLVGAQREQAVRELLTVPSGTGRPSTQRGLAWVPTDACRLPIAEQPQRLADCEDLFATAVGGHRLYSAETVTRLRVIKAAQRLGFTLEEIAALTNPHRHRRGPSVVSNPVPAPNSPKSRRASPTSKPSPTCCTRL